MNFKISVYFTASENGFTKQAELNNLEIFETTGLVKESIFIDDLGP